MVGRITSEYLCSFGRIETAQQEYNERFNFRMYKRDKEYCHQPFLWDSGDESDDRGDKKLCTAQPATESNHDAVQQGTQSVDDFRSVRNKDLATQTQVDEIYVPRLKNTEENGRIDPQEPDVSIHVDSSDRVDVATQTESQRHNRPSAVLRKAFVPYAIGSSPSYTGDRLTFNVKCGRDVHPSAVRADARRKERPFINEPVCRKPGIAPPVKNIGSDFLITSQSTNAGTEQKLRSMNSAISERSESKVTSNWLSEYHQKYPEYPASVYVRSASMAVSRCRPFSASSTRQAASRTASSITPQTPVLLSSRSSKTQQLKRTYGEPCDICFIRATRNAYPSTVINEC